jgi:hypothetical protein
LRSKIRVVIPAQTQQNQFGKNKCVRYNPSIFPANESNIQSGESFRAYEGSRANNRPTTDRPQIGRKAQPMRIPLAVFILAIFSSPSIIGAVQAPADGAPLPAPVPVSGLLQPSLDTVHGTLDALRMEKWKKGNIRDEANQNISEIQHDLQTNLPPLLHDADTAPGTLSKVLPLSRHVNALYDVLLRVVEAARVSAPDDQAAQLQQALVSLGNARLAIGERMQGSADALEKQVVDLRSALQVQAARSPVVPAPAALPCVPPAPHRTTKKTNKPAAKPSPKPPVTTTTAPAKPTP